MGSTDALLALVIVAAVLVPLTLTLVRRSRAQKTVKRRDKALDETDFAKLLEDMPKDPSDAATQVARGWCLLLVGRTDEGLELIRKEGLQQPSEPRARLDAMLGRARAMALTNGDLGLATAIVSKVRSALTQLPDKWLGPVESQLAEIDGWMQLHRGQAAHALASFERSVEHPTKLSWIDAARLYGRACALIELGKNEQGRAALEDAAALGPDRPNVSRAHALLEEMKAGPYRQTAHPR